MTPAPKGNSHVQSVPAQDAELLPRSAASGEPAHQQKTLQTFLDQVFVRQGMITDWALHALPDGKGGWIKKPHFHALVSSRFWKPGRRPVEPNDRWLISASTRSRAIAAWREIAGDWA